MAQKKSDKGFQGLPLPMEAGAAMKSHVQRHLLGREGSSCKEVVNKDRETLTNKMENKNKEKILVKKKKNRRVAPKDHLSGKRSQTLNWWRWLLRPHLPLLPGGQTAGILRMGFLRCHGLISPDT